MCVFLHVPTVERILSTILRTMYVFVDEYFKRVHRFLAYRRRYYCGGGMTVDFSTAREVYRDKNIPSTNQQQHVPDSLYCFKQITVRACVFFSYVLFTSSSCRETKLHIGNTSSCSIRQNKYKLVK